MGSSEPNDSAHVEGSEPVEGSGSVEQANSGARTLIIALLVGVIVAGGLLFAAWLSSGDDRATVERASDRESVTHEFVVPSGTAATIASGGVVDIVPRRLQVKVGDTVRVVNEDDVATNVGIFYVGPGETVTMRFSTPGQVEGVCDVHPSGKFVIDVRA